MGIRELKILKLIPTSIHFPTELRKNMVIHTDQFWIPYLYFFLHINDLPEIINNKSLTILFADDINILVSNSNLTDFLNDFNTFLTI
jgi:hypothetical protein